MKLNRFLFVVLVEVQWFVVAVDLGDQISVVDQVEVDKQLSFILLAHVGNHGREEAGNVRNVNLVEFELDRVLQEEKVVQNGGERLSLVVVVETCHVFAREKLKGQGRDEDEETASGVDEQLGENGLLGHGLHEHGRQTDAKHA